MDFVHWFIDFFLHLDAHLAQFVESYGEWTYAILFAIVFCETGLVVTAILPGDSLLFAAGALAALGTTEGGEKTGLNLWVLFALLSGAAILGDTVNYHIGKFLGPKVLRNPNSRIFRKQYLDRTHAYFEKYGGRTIIIARFVPIVRTFAPFVAGVGAMTYAHFIAYNVVGGLLWVLIGVGAGYLFGNIPFVKEHFSLVILGIVFVSILPAVIEVVRERSKAKKA